MTTYHCFEIATDDSFYLYADTQKAVADREFAEHMKELGESVDAYALGYTEADSVEDALNNIRCGLWTSTQKV